MFIMPMLITMQSNGFKAYIFHITRHHKHESILYCHYTSMFVLGYTYIQKLFTHLNLAIFSFQINTVLPWKQLFNKWYKKYSKAHFLKNFVSHYHLKKHKKQKCGTWFNSRLSPVYNIQHHCYFLKCCIDYSLNK